MKRGAEETQQWEDPVPTWMLCSNHWYLPKADWHLYDPTVIPSTIILVLRNKSLDVTVIICLEPLLTLGITMPVIK